MADTMMGSGKAETLNRELGDFLRARREKILVVRALDARRRVLAALNPDYFIGQMANALSGGGGGGARSSLVPPSSVPSPPIVLLLHPVPRSSGIAAAMASPSLKVDMYPPDPM